MNGDLFGPPRWVWRALVAIALCLSLAIIAVGGVTAVVAVNRQSDIVDNTARLDCIARLQAQYVVGVGDALATPPAPNQERADAVAMIKRAGRQLRDLDHACED